jgi:tryptophan-rich sensory protein
LSGDKGWLRLVEIAPERAIAITAAVERWCEDGWGAWEAAVKCWFSLLGFLVLVIGGGLAIGYVTAPGEWYGGLTKPSFTPSGWIFGPVWTVLYVLIAAAGWRTFERDRCGWPMRLWWAQLALNFLWSPVFFAAHRIGLALVVVLLMLVSILAFIASSWRRDRVAAWLFLPYAGWVAFASVLNGAIFTLN